jgi:hypothetical protein
MQRFSLMQLASIALRFPGAESALSPQKAAAPLNAKSVSLWSVFGSPNRRSDKIVLLVPQVWEPRRS